MNPDLLQQVELVVKIIVGLFAIFGAWTAFGRAVAGLFEKWTQRRQADLLKRRELQGHYDDRTIDDATRYYIWPKCTNIDPAHRDEISQALVATREPLKEKVDDFLEGRSGQRHLLILADSGTGKTSFLLNYFAYNLRRRKRKRYDIALVHLGSPDRDERIKSIRDPQRTVLFLDALDEDTGAIQGHRQRVEELMEFCAGFSYVVITCRTQFFPREEEIPKETGIVQVGPRKAGEPSVFKFWRLYLSPLDDDDVRKYISRRYPIWKFIRRDAALGIASKIPLLCARPMLLAHIPDIVTVDQPVYTIGGLYHVMVEAWIDRETAWGDKDELRRFTEILALDIYENRKQRGGERATPHELAELAANSDVSLRPWVMTGRSLLNRDATGNSKFAHRSIMEYLVAKRIKRGDHDLKGVELTELIVRFIYDGEWPAPEPTKCMLILGECTQEEASAAIDRTIGDNFAIHPGLIQDVRWHSHTVHPTVPAMKRGKVLPKPTRRVVADALSWNRSSAAAYIPERGVASDGSHGMFDVRFVVIANCLLAVTLSSPTANDAVKKQSFIIGPITPRESA